MYCCHFNSLWCPVKPTYFNFGVCLLQFHNYYFAIKGYLSLCKIRALILIADIVKPIFSRNIYYFYEIWLIMKSIIVRDILYFSKAISELHFWWCGSNTYKLCRSRSCILYILYILSSDALSMDLLTARTTDKISYNPCESSQHSVHSISASAKCNRLQPWPLIQLQI